MRDHKVVAMPENLEPRVNVEEFVLSQDMKEPPKSRRSMTLGNQGRSNPRKSMSPGRRRVSRSRDIVQEVYDRMGVNYVRGQNSVEFFDSNGSITINSETKMVTQSSTRISSNISNVSSVIASNVPRASEIPNHQQTTKQKTTGGSRNDNAQSLSVDTRNDEDAGSSDTNKAQDEERDERQSIRSTRSVKSMLSAFGGGKSVGSRNSFFQLESPSPSLQKTSYKAPPKFVIATPGEMVGEKIIDCRNANDVDANMSIISFDESHWASRHQQHQEEEQSKVTGNGEFRSRRTSGQLSLTNTQSSNAPHNGTQATIDNSGTKDLNDETINRIVEEKLQAKIAELNASFEEKLRQVEKRTNRRLKEIELKLKPAAIESVGRNHFDSSSKTPRGRHSFAFEKHRL